MNEDREKIQKFVKSCESYQENFPRAFTLSRWFVPIAAVVPIGVYLAEQATGTVYSSVYAVPTVAVLLWGYAHRVVSDIALPIAREVLRTSNQIR